MIGPLSHIPLHAPRDFRTSQAEHAYHDEWQALMAAPVPEALIEDEDGERTGNLGVVLNGFPFPITDRYSQVAASFARWMGTNVGQAMSTLPRRKNGLDRYRLAWGEQNRRLSYVNGGYRISDHLTSSDWSKPQVCRDAGELEVFEFIAVWLDTDGGQAFISRAEARLQAYQGGLLDGQFVITKDFKVIELAEVSP